MRKLIVGAAFVLASSIAFARGEAGPGGAAAGAGEAQKETVSAVNTVLVAFGVAAVVGIAASQ